MSYAEHQQAARAITPRCAVVTLSDTRTAETDVSGRRIKELLAEHGAAVSAYCILKDEPQQFRAQVQDWLSREEIDVILSTGGTGISRRDATIDIVEALLETPLPGFGELFRMLSYEQIGSGAMLSRAAGGVVHRKLLFAMPGSSKAVELAMTKLILPELQHLLRELRR